MQADSKYNGWTNYETWAVNLWLTNDAGSDDYWRRESREVFQQVDLTEHTYSARLEASRYVLAERIKDEITNFIPDGVNGTMYADLLGAAISEVNWNEIAEAFLEDIEADADTLLADAQTHLINVAESRKLESEVFSLSFDTLAHCRALVEEA